MRRYPWAKVSDADLLRLRLCDLGVSIAGSLGDRIDRLHGELAARGLRFRPHCWLSEEWFSPDGIPGIAIPFYLAHPRLAALERRQMYRVEGGSEAECMRILRHEAGHALDTAYRLHRRKRWRSAFGRAAKPYPEYYQPRTDSKRFVLHLGWWYGQSHPSEDFAETFAVWLQPGSRWRKRYAGWPALKKLEVVDELMATIANSPPPIRSRRTSRPLSKLRRTLAEHYAERHRLYRSEYPEIYDRDLRSVFASTGGTGKNRLAGSFVARYRAELRQAVARGTGEHPYIIDQVLEEMILRARQLKLRFDAGESTIKMRLGIFLSVQILRNVHTVRHRIAL